MFYSQTTGGFYSAAFHGARRIFIVDPAWVRPVVQVDFRLGKSSITNGEAVSNEIEEGELVSNEIEEIMTVEVPDMTAQPSLIEVDNPDCRIPPDAVEISDEYHAELLSGQQTGKIIAAGEDGYPVLLDPPPPTLEQAIKQYERAVQGHMDAAAKAAGYDDIKTAVTYADEPVVTRFHLEGAAFRAWRSLCWDYCYAQLDAVQAGRRTTPTVDEFLVELPILVLPS